MEALPAQGSGEIFGLVAGWGEYPLVVARELRRRGYRLVGLGVKQHADPKIESLCDDFRWLGLGKLGAAIRFFRRRGVRHATMAGKIHKVRLFQRLAWLRHLPDWRAIRTFAHHFLLRTRDCQDDTLLTAVVDQFAREGITFRPATDLIPELLVRYGQLTRRGPSRAQKKDIAFGWKLAKTLGGLDVGQTVAVKAQAALAVEAIEGTDECILRAGRLCPSGGFTVVKVAKPQQDMRFDVPTIGRGTLQSMLAAGATLLAVEAGKTIVVAEPEVIEFANRHALAIVALHDGQAVDTLEEAA
jgi:DUF1009 family protein